MIEVGKEHLDELAKRLDALRDEARRDAPVEDSSPELWRFLSVSFALSLFGWVSFFMVLSALKAEPFDGSLGAENRLSWGAGWCILGLSGACALALGKFSRWIAAHHLCHKGYDQARGLPRALRSDRFGQRGVARLLWVDWMPTSAWIYEHNVRHIIPRAAQPVLTTPSVSPGEQKPKYSCFREESLSISYY